MCSHIRIHLMLYLLFCANEIGHLRSRVSRVGALFTISSRHSDDIDFGLKIIVHGLCMEVQYILSDSNMIKVLLLDPYADFMISLLVSIDVSRSHSICVCIEGYTGFT